MKTYWEVFKFNALITFKAYPLDIVIFSLKRILETFFIVFFWVLVSNNLTIKLNELISYFLISGGVSELILINRIVIGSNIRNLVRSGELSNFLLRPINSIWYIYFTCLGNRALVCIIAIINILIGIILNSNISFSNILYFLIFLYIAIFISISINFLTGILFIKTNSVGGLLSVIDQIIRVLSGYTIPLKFFPAFWANILYILPFSFMTTLPTVMFTSSFADFDKGKMLFIGFIWAIFLFVFTSYLWKKTLKSYEAYGI